MEYFYANYGGRLPFQYQIKVKSFTDSMHDWCANYDDENKNFRRWYVNWDHDDTIIINFEWEQAALMFALAFGNDIC